MSKRRINKKRIVSVLCTVFLSMALMLTAAIESKVFAESLLVAVAPSKVTIDGVKYTTIKARGGNLYPGNYALSSDVTLTNFLKVANGAGSDEPTVIVLNGYSLTGPKGSYEACIQVSEGSKLIIKDKEGAGGKIVGCYTAVSVNNGSVTIENAELSSNTFCAVDAYNSSVSVLGSSKLSNNGNGSKGIGAIYAENSTVTLSGGEISGNNCGISCGEGAVLSASGNVAISGNKTGILLANDTSLSISNGLVVSANINSGIECTENQKISFLSEHDDSKRTLVEITLKDEFGNIKDARLTLPRLFKGYRNSLAGCGSAVVVVANDNALSYAVVEPINCTGHQYSYTVDGNTINANCDVCGVESKITLGISAYYDNHMSSYFVSDDSVGKEIYIDLDSWDDYRVNIYPRIVYKNVETADVGFDIPTSYGTYTAKLVLLEDENDINSAFCETAEVQFAMMCNAHKWEYISDGEYIYAKCINCGGVLAQATLRLNNYDLSNIGSESLILYDCQEDKFVSDITVAGKNLGLGTFAVVYGYHQADDSIKYSFTAPDEDGEYIVRIAVLKRANNPNSAIASTTAIEYTYKHHNWEYSANGDSINAHCDKCNASASVCLDNSEVLSAARNYADTGSGSFSGNVFCDNGWSSKEGIKKYHILYKDNNGGSYTNDRSILNNASFNCIAKIVLLQDENDINSVNLESDERTFYFATKTVDQIEVESFSDSNMKVPRSDSNASYTTYYVGCAEELYWAAKNAGSNDLISITNDIVVNPLVLSSDSKSIYSASDTIYNWVGFGSEYSKYFSGKIYGNGHTIYGLYSDNQLAGLIAHGRDFVVTDLTIKDSVFIGDIAGGIVASAQAYEVFGETQIDNCSVLNCCFMGGEGTTLYEAGGIIGYFRFDIDSTYLLIRDCISNSYINAYRVAGGIIGECRVEPSYFREVKSTCYYIHIESCLNLGSTVSKEVSGGIIGTQNGTKSNDIFIEDCRNSGRIEGYVVAGGLIGLAHDSESASDMKQYVYNSVNIGDIYCSGTGAGGLLGVGQYKNLACNNDAYYGAVHAVGAIYAYNDNTKYYVIDDSVGTLSSDAEGTIKLTRDLARKANLCNGFTVDGSGNATKANSMYEHIAGEWQTVKIADCINGGEKVRMCIVCGEVITSSHSDAHGHDYSNGNCVYCGEADQSSLASIFSVSTSVIIVIVGLILFACAFALIYILRIRKEKNPSREI